MKDIYYVQLQAGRILKCIYRESYTGQKVCQEYLRGLEEDQFWSACSRLREMMISYYSKAAESPDALKLPLFEIENYRSTSAEARQGNAALIQFPAALLALGNCVELTKESMTVDVKTAKSLYADLKCKYFQQQFEYLTEFGFEFEPLKGNTLPKSGTITVFYPENPDIFVVLAAMSNKLLNYKQAYQKTSNAGLGLHLLEQFIFLCPAIFADSSEQMPSKSLDHMAGAVGPGHQERLETIVTKCKERGLTLQFDTAFLKNRFINEKGKDTLCYIEYGDYKTIWQDGNEQFYFRLKLNHPDAYGEKIKELPPHLQSAFTDVWCSNCADQCNRRIVYHMDGQEKRACGCFFFTFKNPAVEDVDKLMELYDLEQKACAKK